MVGHVRGHVCSSVVWVLFVSVRLDDFFCPSICRGLLIFVVFCFVSCEWGWLRFVVRVRYMGVLRGQMYISNPW